MRRLGFTVVISVFYLLVAVQVQAQALPMWKIEGTSNHIYLLGSIHFLRAEDHPLPSAMTRALSDADIVVMELDLAAMNPLEAQSTLLRLAVDPDGRDLADMLGSGTYREAGRLATGIDIDLEAMRPFEPWYAAMQITQLRLMQLGFDGTYGVESQLLLQAMQEGKEMRGLETLDEQLEALDSLPLAAQKKFFIQTLEEAADMEEQLDDILEAWQTGNEKSLERELSGGMEDHPILYNQLLITRNKNWTQTILGYINDKNDYLIVVGALHLVGKDSVPQMLADKGYATRQISH
jgi:uncharacterized protein YbaP (TraB family)